MAEALVGERQRAETGKGDFQLYLCGRNAVLRHVIFTI